MDFELAEHHLALRSLLRDFAEKEIEPVIAEYDQKAEPPLSIIEKIGSMGLPGLPFQEKYGGKGADRLCYVIFLEELGRANLGLAVTFSVSTTLAGYPVDHFGSEEQKQTWIVPLAQGKTLGYFGLTEPDAGSDVQGIATTAVLKGDEWVLNGTKCFITNPGLPNCAFGLVPAVTGKKADGRKEISNFIVPTRIQGIGVAPPYVKPGLRTCDTREVSFVDCRVPRENLVGELGSGMRQVAMCIDEGRLNVAAFSIGMIDRCLDMSMKYARGRVQFGQPVFNFQAIQFRLVDIAVNVELARTYAYKVAHLVDKGKPFSKEAAMVKLFATEAAQKAAAEAMQVVAGTAFTTQNPVERVYRDCRLVTLGLGTSEIVRTIIARSI